MNAHRRHARPFRPTPPRRGFGMFELVIVAVVVAVLVGTALPRFNAKRYEADAAGRLARTVLQSAQRRAIAQQREVTVAFDVARRGFRIAQAAAAGESTAMVQVRTLEQGSIFAAPGWPGVNGTQLSAAVAGRDLGTLDGLPSVTFRRDGSATSDAELYVTTDAGTPGEFRAVTIIGATGKAELWKWAATAWTRVQP